MIDNSSLKVKMTVICEKKIEKTRRSSSSSYRHRRRQNIKTEQDTFIIFVDEKSREFFFIDRKADSSVVKGKDKNLGISKESSHRIYKIRKKKKIKE